MTQQPAESEVERLDAEIRLADSLLFTSTTEALAMARRCHDVAERSRLEHQSALSLRIVGQAHHLFGDHREALDHLRDARARLERLGEFREVINATFSIGNALADLSDYATALEEYERLSELIDVHGNAVARASHASNLGLVYAEIGDYGRALDCYGRALELGEQTGHLRLISSACGNMGIVYQKLGSHDIAIDFFERARGAAEEVGYQTGVATWLDNIGTALRDLSRPKEALEQLEAGRELAERIGSRRVAAFAAIHIATVLIRLQDFDRALVLLQETLPGVEERESRAERAEVLLTIAEIYRSPAFSRRDLESSNDYLMRAVALDSGVKEQLARIYRSLTEIAAERRDWERAFEHQRRCHELEVELQSIEAHKKAQQLAHERRIAEIERIRAVEKAESAAAEEIARMKSKQLEQDLANATLQLLAQSEMLEEIRADLGRILRKIPPSEPAARDLREKINSLPSRSVDWIRFDEQFRAVHPEFVRTLIERAPTLTPTELRVCALLRMSLKTHEIAQIFSTTEKGIDFHRGNIRRKLGLRRDEKLPLVIAAM